MMQVDKLLKTFFQIVKEPLSQKAKDGAREQAHAYIIARRASGGKVMAGDCLWQMAIGTMVATEPTMSLQALTRLEAAYPLFNECPDLIVLTTQHTAGDE
jgi:hypothetical protein